MMSCLCYAHAMQTMMTWCSYKANINDIMPPRFYVTSCWACALHACEHGAGAIIKMGAFKYLNGLTGTPADSNLTKLPASHFKAPINQNANENMPNMFP